MIHPIQGRLLIQLKGKYQNFSPTEEKFGTSKTRGVVLAIAPDIIAKCQELGIEDGKMVYFGKYEDTAPYGEKEDLALIKLEEIGGWE
jgi:co-chaperonin GroES (HSP10)